MCSSDLPVATAQCHRYLRENLPLAEVRAANSTAEAARLVGTEKLSGTAAIAPSNAAPLYGLDVIASNIEDHAGNQTRFVVIGASGVPAPTGHDVTGIVVLTPDGFLPGNQFQDLCVIGIFDFRADEVKEVVVAQKLNLVISGDGVHFSNYIGIMRRNKLCAVGPVGLVSVVFLGIV